MNLLSWNCRGLGNPRTVQDLYRMVEEKRPKVIFLIETKANASRLDGVRRRLGFEGCFVVEAVGRKGGLALLWREEVGVEVYNFSQWHISVWMGKGGESARWLLFGFYGQPETAKRKESWNLLARLCPDSHIAWCVLGDFNEITSQSEKEGGRQSSESQMGAFREALKVNGLFDLGYKGNGFTWCNQHADSSFTRERLDRGVANGEWISKFNVTVVENMVARTSDHSPVLLKLLEGNLGTRRRVKLFKYEAKWATIEGCDQVVEGVWRERGSGLSMQKLQRALTACSGALVRWSKMKEKEEGKNIKEKTAQLEELYNREVPQDVGGVKLLREEVGRLLEQENIKWKQRAKRDWLLLGDQTQSSSTLVLHSGGGRMR
ncbi:uncharacterized protein LOC122311987 [Carya illinoinensis]|uniref:uncharacterized protein LOC122311987 n=1 Tax=Carya illinoinensis TaxID=32201 RepID=UPI001C71A62B|nr:uncharacterized protein LOC122311987 [Carya illinoinensis]